MIAATTAGADILVVDDEPLARAGVTAVLEAHGFRVAAVANGREALNYLRTHRPPRLILLDLMMPVMNGWEFRKDQRRDATMAAIPVVVCSGAESVPAEAALIGAQGHLEKPVRPEELVETVSRFCQATAGQAPAAGPGASAT